MSLAGVNKKGKKCYQVYGQNNGKISYKSKKLPKTKSGNIFFAFLEHCFETNWLAEHILFMAKKMPKSVTKARSRQKPNLVTFLERCFENKLAGRTHSVYGPKDVKISYKSKKSPKPNLETFFAFFLNPASDILR
jgi:hypothetical protein